MNDELWSVNYDLWIITYEIWIMSYEIWVINYQLWVISHHLSIKNLCLGRSGGQSRVIPGSFQGHSRVIPGSFWGHSGVIPGSICGHSRLILGSFQGYSASSRGGGISGPHFLGPHSPLDELLPPSWLCALRFLQGRGGHDGDHGYDLRFLLLALPLCSDRRCSIRLLT